MFDNLEQRRSAELFTRVADVAEALTADLSTSEIVRALMEQGMAGLGAQGASVALIDPDGWLAYIAAVGVAAELQLNSGLVELERRIPMAHAALHLEPVFVESADDAAVRFPDITADRHGCRAYAAVPLVLGGRARAVLGVTFADERSFDEIDRRFVVTIANIGARGLVSELGFEPRTTVG
ncbi:MAG: GAF domain-containing protein [Acidimicrobiales bacterium]